VAIFLTVVVVIRVVAQRRRLRSTGSGNLAAVNVLSKPKLYEIWLDPKPCCTSSNVPTGACWKDFVVRIPLSCKDADHENVYSPWQHRILSYRLNLSRSIPRRDGFQWHYQPFCRNAIKVVRARHQGTDAQPHTTSHLQCSF
jgi:hypothetical protein